MREKEWMFRAKLGDKAALEKIVELYYNDIYTFLARRLGNPFIAQDLTQETFLKFTKNLLQYKEQNKLRSYLFTLALNCSNDWFRRCRNDLPLDEEQFSDKAEDSCNTEEDFDLTEQALMIRQAIMALPDWQRDVVILRYYHDMKLKSISQIIGIPVATVKTRLYRANKSLKDSLGEHCYER